MTSLELLYVMSSIRNGLEPISSLRNYFRENMANLEAFKSALRGQGFFGLVLSSI